jgi:CheY-like chemotaxis protein
MKHLKKLIIVDDDDVFVFLTKKAIEKNNILEVIKIFGNGLDALNFMKENVGNPDLLPEIILLDLSMPVMDGWQFLEAYVKMNPKVEKEVIIYICSSSISPEDGIRAKNISAVSDYMIKPVSKEKLVEIIEQL